MSPLARKKFWNHPRQRRARFASPLEQFRGRRQTPVGRPVYLFGVWIHWNRFEGLTYFANPIFVRGFRFPPGFASAEAGQEVAVVAVFDRAV